MHNTVDQLISIQKKIQEKLIEFNCDNKPNIIAISKTYPLIKLMPLITSGHVHFGENKVQEALEKWSEIKNDKIKLHLVGKLQTNKVKYAVPLFDYIHSLDSLKLAEKISSEQIKKNKKLKIFIQINIGNETQKSGIKKEELNDFYKICNKDLGLNIIGLMCLPPKEVKQDIYFSEMFELSKKIGISELSMGMSDDYENAVKFGSTYLRIGTKIFGNRN